MENSEEKKLEMGNEVLNQNEENEKMMTVEEAIKEENTPVADGTNDKEKPVDDEMVDDADEEDEEEEENDSGFDWGMEDAAAAGILTLAGVGVAVAIKKALDFFMDEDDADQKEEKK